MTTQINPLPTPPSPADSPVDFNAKAFALLGALPAFVSEANAQAAGLDASVAAAGAQAAIATNKASAALTSANNAALSKTGADSARDAAVIAQNAAEAALDSFDDRYLGQKPADPANDNDGGALLVGALYFRTTAPIGMKVWTGTAWDDAYANLSSKFDKTGGDVNGNINFTGTGRRITGDFSNGTIASRVMFQTSTVNGNTVVSTLPNGSSTTSGFRAYGSDNLLNGVSADLIASISSGDVRLISNAYGTGTYLPLAFHTGGSERMRIDTSGNVLVTNAAGIGYGVGAGGTVVQATSKSTEVTLNKPCGRIVMHNAALAAGAAVVFNFTNATIAHSDEVSLTMISGANYRVEPIDIWNGGCAFRVTNISASSLSYALAFNFKVFKVALS